MPSAGSLILGAMRRVARQHIPAVQSMPEEAGDSLTRYCPHKPWPKQQMYLSLDCEEAFFGGAAGGGKSDVLLMAALQYVHVPNYHALIIRKSYKLLSKAGAIMSRAREWLWSTDAKWNHETKSFRFPSGATIEFGYLDNPKQWMNYLGTDYQFIGWDELTEIQLAEDSEDNPYLCLFRSLRQTTDMSIPLRVRSASNPGGIGHGWVKKRFITDEARAGLRNGEDRVFDATDGRKFVPSLAKDNPSLNLEKYTQSLMHLPAITRARQMNGDWDVAASLQIPDDWLLSYIMQGQIICPVKGEAIDERNCRRFATIDTAGTSRDKAEENRGKPPSWSFIGIWDHDRKGKRLFLRSVFRDRVGWNELKLRAAEFLAQWGCKRVLIENAHVGQPLADELRAKQIQVELVGPVLPGMADGYRGAKLERAIASSFLTMLESGRVFFPAEADWRSTYDLELTSWTGHPDEPADQIDGSSYAAHEAKQGGSSWGGPVVMSGGNRSGNRAGAF